MSICSSKKDALTFSNCSKAYYEFFKDLSHEYDDIYKVDCFLGKYDPVDCIRYRFSIRIMGDTTRVIFCIIKPCCILSVNMNDSTTSYIYIYVNYIMCDNITL